MVVEKIQAKVNSLIPIYREPTPEHPERDCRIKIAYKEGQRLLLFERMRQELLTAMMLPGAVSADIDKFIDGYQYTNIS